MKSILKVTLPFDEGVIKSEFILPKKTLTSDEAIRISTAISILFESSLCYDVDFKEIFNNRHIKEYSVGFESKTSCEKSCTPPIEPIEALDL